MASNRELEVLLVEFDAMRKLDDSDSDDSFDSAFDETQDASPKAGTPTSDCHLPSGGNDEQQCSDHGSENLDEEDPEKRAAAVEVFRTWVKEEARVKRCRLDDVFLLRFLRMAKFDVENAQVRFMKYFEFRRSVPQWIRNLDMEKDENLRRLVTKGAIFVLPERDDEGRRVIFHSSEKYDPSTDKVSDMIRLFLVTFETLLEDEENQIKGVVHVNDGRGVTFAKIAAWSPFEMKMILRHSEKAYPLRHKTLHMVNLPSWAGYLASIIRHGLSAKMRDRLQVHLNGMEDVCQHVPRRILPKEYGGTLPMAEMTRKWLEELRAHRNSILALDKTELVDLEEKQGWGFGNLFSSWSGSQSKTDANTQHEPLKQQHSCPAFFARNVLA